MNRFRALRSAPLLAALALSACGGGGDSSLRDGLDSLPQDTGTMPTPVEVDTGPTASASAPVPFPAAVDTTPWVPEERPAPVPSALPGEWTTGAVIVPKPQGFMSTLSSVRVARHPEFDRVVLEFSGDLPGYHVEYIEHPVRACGSGDVVPVPGDAWLGIHLSPSRAHDENGRATLHSRVIRPSVANILEMQLICDFEGQVGWVLGVRSPGQFRVLELSEPSRLAIDVGR